MPEKANQADIAVVEALCNRLVAAFERFADEELENHPDGLRYLDALMGCHNFYKAIILDLERRTGECMIRRIAIDTLRQALEKR